MSKLTESELKAICRDFRVRSSQLCNAKWQDVKGRLSNLLSYVKRIPILNDYIQGCRPSLSNDELEKMIADNSFRCGKMPFDLGKSDSEQLAHLYQILQIADECETCQDLFTIGRVFDYGTSFQDSVNGFVYGIVTPFVNAITQHLHTVSMSVRSIPEKHITINASGNYAQITIAQDNSTITASQNNAGGCFEEIEKELRNINVMKDDIDELRNLCSTEKPVSRENLGDKLNCWIVNIVGKAAKGSVKLSMEVATGVLVNLICKYYGI